MGAGLVKSYFPHLDEITFKKFEELGPLYEFWNERINVISRKDIPNLYTNHILHSLSLQKVITFGGGDRVIDIGTGGGFPGIPLAIMNPDAEFTLLDSRGKKIMVVEEISRALGLDNVNPVHARAEEFHGVFNYIVSRAVTTFPELVRLSSRFTGGGETSKKGNGLYCLKGGNLSGELKGWFEKVSVFDIATFFNEDYFQSKSIVFLPSRKIRR